MVTIIGHQVQRRRRSQEIWWGGQNQARTAAAKLEMKNLIGFLLKAEFNFPDLDSQNPKEEEEG